jgi:hypothetical protein
MPGHLIQVGSQIICTHGGQATGIPSSPRVLAGGQPVHTLPDTFTVAGCPFQVPIGAGTKPQPCMTIKWLVPATRVMIAGNPALLRTSSGMCQSAEQIPQGAPSVTTTQMKVSAT